MNMLSNGVHSATEQPISSDAAQQIRALCAAALAPGSIFISDVIPPHAASSQGLVQKPGVHVGCQSVVSGSSEHVPLPGCTGGTENIDIVVPLCRSVMLTRRRQRQATVRQ
jgi:hypothetical protein